MLDLKMRGVDLAQFVIASNDDGRFAAQDAARRCAMGAKNQIRREIRTRFSTAGRVWNARGLAMAIKMKKVSNDWWQVIDRSVYAKKRSERFSLSWVFDNTPLIRGKKGWVAVPIPGQAPLASSGRRYAWPSEAAARGWSLEIVPVAGKPNLKIIMGRQGSRGPWIPLYYYIPPYRHGRRLDLDAVHRLWAGRMEGEWDKAFDRRQAKRMDRRVA